MHQDIEKTLLSSHQIQTRVAEVGLEIYRHYQRVSPDGKAQLTIVPILTGSMIFAADLIRHLPVRMKIRLVSISSYPGASTSSKGAHMQTELSGFASDLTGHHVLLIDDILDSGQTLKLASEQLSSFNPSSLTTCVLLRKNRPQAMSFKVDHVCFDIPDEFVVGYGLDFAGYYRNLPTISVLKPEVIRLHQAETDA